LPPVGYAGIERVVSTLAQQLHGRDHELAVFAPDSRLPCEVSLEDYAQRRPGETAVVILEPRPLS
jgi:hypothetical protein